MLYRSLNQLVDQRFTGKGYYVHASDCDTASRYTLALRILCAVLVVICFAIPIVRHFNSGRAAGLPRCSTNLRQIGLAIKMYANENNDLLPPDFKALLLTQDITTYVFVCPSSNDDVQQVRERLTPEQIASSVVEGTKTCSYYLCRVPGQGLESLSPATVLAFEPASNHDGDGANVRYADGRVDWVAKPECDALIRSLLSGPHAPATIPAPH